MARFARTLVLVAASWQLALPRLVRADHATSLVLKWRAPRGNAGKPPPRGTPEWEAFNGHPSARLVSHLQDPGHADPVPLSGLRSASRNPSHPLSEADIAAAFASLGVPRTIARRAADQALLGLPSGADLVSINDHLIVRNDVVLSYSSSRKAPNWVSWRVRPDDLGPSPRSDDKWRSDPSLPARFGFITFHDYEHSGFDPGHMLPSADRTSTRRENERTYVTSNTVPQSFNNNRGPWAKLEMFTRDRVKYEGLEAHVLAGPIYGKNPLTIGDAVPVPNAVWKVVFLLPRGGTLADVTAETRVISVIIPNNDIDVSEAMSFESFISTPEEIERRTGLRFFTSLPTPLANALRVKRDGGSANSPVHP